MKIALQMDHISGLQIRGDTTFALALEAARRGYHLFHYTPDTLSQRGNEVFASLEPLTVYDVEGDHYRLGSPQRYALSEMDVVLLRQDPPFDMHYITTTHLLERIHPDTLVVNNPVSVRNCPEKIFVTQFADLMPETLISQDRAEIEAFRAELGDIIIKPLYGNGGAGVFHITPQDRNLSALLELFAAHYREPFIVQRYLPEVRAGDKRIILLDGKPMGAINRVPAENDARSNMHVGGRAEKSDLGARDHEICARLGPALQAHGFLLTGIDVIGGFLTEINVTSPTGIREIQRFGGANIAIHFWDAVETKLSAF